jgi:H+/Cl- antiporter ClcA
MLSSIIAALCGGAVGREGPTIQISAYIFHSIGCRFSKVWQPPSQDIYFIAGGAAGIASAFNTPLGGVVYAIEELSKTSFHKFRTSLFTAVIIAGVVAQILSGPYLFIGAPKMHAYSSNILPYSTFIGLVAGILGALFGKILFWLSQFRKSITNPYILAGLAIFFGLLIATLIVFINPIAAGSGKTLINSYLFKGESSSIQQVLIRFFSPIITYSSGTAGGVFSPALSTGASIGAFIADIFSTPYRNTFVVLGMIGFLSGFTAAPFTSFLLVLEMTDKHSIVFSMMLTSLSAYAVAQLLSKKPFYELMCNVFVEEETSLKKDETKST